MCATVARRRLAVGAEVMEGTGVHFRVWAPQARLVEVVLGSDGPAVALAPEAAGYHGGLVETAGAGTRYGFRLDGGSRLLPDPASRFQPEGPHGLSCVVDPSTFRWTDSGWQGVRLAGQVIYEMHVGTFTPAGTWEAAARELPELAAVGVTVIELMPVADFPGRFGWGYDGVDLFAPTRLYGEPDDFRRFVDRAHALGLGVILDVVYNHVGPDGNYLKAYSVHYFTDRYPNEWGEAINFDGGESGPVREFYLANVAYWIDEYHLDGLRLDATQQIHDASAEHILAALGRRVRAAAGASAPFLYFADHTPELARLVRKGRIDFLRQFPALAAPEMQAQLPDPADPATFERSKLDLSERERHAEMYALHRDLLALRREDLVFARQRPGGLDGAVLGDAAFVLRYFDGAEGDRLLLVNLGRELTIDPAPEPLLAPPDGARWELRWSSEDPRYGGIGTPPVEGEEGWHLPGEAAIVLQPAPEPRPDG